jgi:predicted Fe-Mo cluster-binding NifX family protein
MRVSKPPAGSLSGLPVGLPAAKAPGAKGFADKLARVSGTAKARTTAAPAARAGRVSSVTDIGKALKAGQITPQMALDRVVERIVARRVGPNGTAAVRDKISAALRQTLEDDPMLAAKIRALGDE